MSVMESGSTSLKQTDRFSLQQKAIVLLALCLLVRFLSLGLYPLMDTTEARYGEMARIMFETGNWITPMFDYDIPFWGKPPLFSWLSALGFSTLGVTEFAARVPHFLVSLLVIVLVFKLAKSVHQKTETAYLAILILASTSAFSLYSGAVMTDTALTFAITLSMVSFWQAWQLKSRLWGYAFFVGLAIGLLSKGPLALVLVGMSIFLWVLFGNHWRRLYQALPWVTGSLLMLVISLPWYIIAEYESPGFLNYFIVGEHFKRYVVSGWSGDLYGTAHKQTRGTIWLYWLVVMLPWTPILAYQVVRLFKQGKETQSSNNGYISFLWCWVLAPLILFSFAGNILHSYLMPILPAIALLIMAYHERQNISEHVFKLALFTPILLSVLIFAISNGWTSKQSEKGLMQVWSKQQEANKSDLVYLGKRPFSAQFYSNGKAVSQVESFTSYRSKLKRPSFVVLAKKSIASKIKRFGCEVRGESKARYLLYCMSPE